MQLHFARPHNILLNTSIVSLESAFKAPVDSAVYDPVTRTMPNHSDVEKACIRTLTVTYLPSNLELLGARRDCPFKSLHIQQASYGQKKSANIGIVFEYVSIHQQHCIPHSHNGVLSVSHTSTLQIRWYSARFADVCGEPSECPF